MRATISFEIDVDKVEETMAALVEQQSDTLRLVTNILDNVGKSTLLEEVTEALDLLEEASSQLKQYRQMMVSFEKAKFETLLPQSAEQAIPVIDNIEKLNEAKKNMQGLESFLGKIAEEASTNATDQEVKHEP
jgi:hypothetical protein